MKTESTTQKHTKHIPYAVRRILLKTNLQWTNEKNTMWKIKMKLMNLKITIKILMNMTFVY